jgi:AraC family transcriptional regulator
MRDEVRGVAVLRNGQFYGQTRARTRVAGLILMETLHPPRLQTPVHCHESAHFCLMLRGSYTESYDAKSRACIPSSLVFHPPAELHSQMVDDSEVHSFVVEIEGWPIDGLSEYSSVLSRPSEFQGGIPAMFATKLYKEFRNQDAVSPLAIQGLFLELLAAVARGEARQTRRAPDPWLKRVEDLLRAGFRESLTLKKISQQVDVHPVHLAREFRKCFGSTVGEYVRNLRIEHARALIERKVPLKEVALEAGFFDQSHFSRVFRQVTGMRPSEYRALKTSPDSSRSQ